MKLLHRARSLRRLPHCGESSASHKRDASSSSDASRASSSGSDTSTRERGPSVEWDPLRLHPSMEVDSSPHVMPRYDQRRFYHQQPGGVHHHHAHSHESGHAAERRQAGFSLEIYDGFDFGFDSKSQQRRQQLPHDDAHASPRRLRAPKSEADLRHEALFELRLQQEQDAIRAMPRPQPRPRVGGSGEADDFIKRGGWKRRGIVFGYTSEESLSSQESEDDCFDLP